MLIAIAIFIVISKAGEQQHHVGIDDASLFYILHAYNSLWKS